MATHDIRTQDRDSLARFLGWFSIALGAAEAAAPRAMCRLVGARGKGRSPLVMRLLGARELAQGLGILVRPRPTGWLWARAAGDLLDLGALGVVAARGHGRKRTAFAIASVAVVTVPDVYEALHLSRRQGPPVSGKRVRKAVTIARSRQEVEAAWNLPYTPTFADAPGGRGTEVAVELVEDPPAGELGALARKLGGDDPATRLADGLRRFKQQVETGEVVRSDSTPHGHLLADHLRPRAAQPLEREEVRT